MVLIKRAKYLTGEWPFTFARKIILEIAIENKSVKTPNNNPIVMWIKSDGIICFPTVAEKIEGTIIERPNMVQIRYIVNKGGDLPRAGFDAFQKKTIPRQRKAENNSLEIMGLAAMV